MNNNGFYINVDNQEVLDNNMIVENRKFNTKYILIGVLVLILIFGIVYFLLINPGSNSKYELEIDPPSIMYMEEPLDIPIKVLGNKRRIEDSVTSFILRNDSIISLLETEFIGENGSITITPVAIGKDKVHIITTVGADEKSKTLVEKDLNVVVCPVFGDNLLSSKEVTLQRGSTSSLNIDFGEKECSEIVTYDSTDTNIVTVDDNGIITGINSGTASIRVFNGTTNIIVNVKVI